MSVNVLLVDDEEEICDFLKEELEKMNLQVSTAISGEEALALLPQKQWHILVVDLKLSTAITGLDVIKAGREKCPDAFILAMSGYVDVGLRQDTERLGITYYLEKPCDIQRDVFCEKIKSLLNRMN